jgi:hypothetical protein
MHSPTSECRLPFLSSLNFRIVAGLWIALAIADPGIAQQRVPSGYVLGCDLAGCFDRDPTGGFGLRPLRRYELLYAGKPVCHEIVSVINSTITGDKEAAEHKIRRPLPDYVRSSSAQESFYRAANPIFANDKFLKWNYLNEDPEGWQLKEQIESGKDSGWRWIIAHVLNDGEKYVVTTRDPWSLHMWYGVGVETLNSDWSRAQNYTRLTSVEQPWNDRYAFVKTDPLNKARNVFPTAAGMKRSDFPEYAQLHPFWRLSVQLQSFFPWRNIDRSGMWPNFAKINDRIYLILLDSRTDVLVVVDVLRNSSEDLCYAPSTVTASLVPR